MTEPTERQKCFLNISIEKQRQYYHCVNQLTKCIVVFGTIQHSSIIMSDKCATSCLDIAKGMRRLSYLRIPTSIY